METDETENGKLKRKAETEKLKFGNGRDNCSKSYLLRMRERCAYVRVFLLSQHLSGVSLDLGLRTRL